MARNTYRFLRKWAKRGYSYVLLAGMVFRNRFSSAPVCGSAKVMISLTSFGDRIKTSAFAIESLAAGSVRPERFVLWLAHDEQKIPASLRRLERRGLEIKYCEDFGSHKKYYPSLPLAIESDLPLVTADDDLLYPRTWLQKLDRAAVEHPTMINCYRASVIATEGDEVAPYNSWPRCKSTTPTVAHFATTGPGVIFPVRVLRELERYGTGFMQHAPRADDIWMHWVAMRSQVPIRQISRKAKLAPYIHGTQRKSLVFENVVHGGNDRQIANLYTPDDVAQLNRAGAVQLPAPELAPLAPAVGDR